MEACWVSGEARCWAGRVTLTGMSVLASRDAFGDSAKTSKASSTREAVMNVFVREPICCGAKQRIANSAAMNGPSSLEGQPTKFEIWMPTLHAERLVCSSTESKCQLRIQFVFPRISPQSVSIAPSPTSASSSTLSESYWTRFHVVRRPLPVSNCQTRALRWDRFPPNEPYPPKPLAPP